MPIVDEPLIGPDDTEAAPGDVTCYVCKGGAVPWLGRKRPAIHDYQSASWLQRAKRMAKHPLGLVKFVVRVAYQHGICAFSREVRIVLLADCDRDILEAT